MTPSSVSPTELDAFAHKFGLATSMPSLERTEAEALASAVTLRSIASPSSEVGSCAVAPVSADGEEPRYASLQEGSRKVLGKV